MVMKLVIVAVGYREEFGKGLGVHKGFVLSPLLSGSTVVECLKIVPY